MKPDEPNSGLLVVQSRREFCANACGAATVVVAGGWLSACGGGSPTSPSGDQASLLPVVSASVAGRTVSVAVDSASALAAVGSAALAQTSVGSFLIAHTGQDAFMVLTATCTHEGCTITGYDNPRFVCPCHGSQYTTSGTVVQGPAPRALTQFPSQVANSVLSFTA